MRYRQDPKDWAEGRVAKKCSKSDKHTTPHKKESDFRKGRRGQNYWLVIIGEKDHCT